MNRFLFQNNLIVIIKNFCVILFAIKLIDSNVLNIINCSAIVF